MQPQAFARPPPPHVAPVPEQVPHDDTGRTAPQRSTAEMAPHVAAFAVHSSASVSAEQPQTLATPPPPQVRPVPEQKVLSVTVRVTPQLSGAVTVPQSLPRRAANCALLSGAHAQTLEVPPPPHVCVPPQVPQAAVRQAPQLSAPEALPQLAPRRAQKAASVSAVQPQRLAAPPPPQVCAPEQLPQFTERAWPHWSVPVTTPQLAPWRAQN
jgi:hypothetical protein